MSQGAKYKYYITYNSVQTEVFPIFEKNAEIKYENPGDQISLLKKFDVPLVFYNNDNNDDYTYFKNIEDTDKCALLELAIHQKCAGVYTSIMTAEFGTVDGKWDLDNCTFSITPNPSGVYASLLDGTAVNILNASAAVSVKTYPEGTLVTFSRMRTFDSVLLYVAQQTCSDVNSIISNFFQINEVTTSTYNYVTDTTNMYTNMLMASLSEIRNPAPSNAATTELITFKELMDDLRTLFHVYWYVDSSNNVRIEHYSFFNDTVGLVLTGAGYTDYVSGTNKYGYDRVDMPRYETWSMVNSEMGCEIKYDNACGLNKLNENRITYSCKKLFTDFYKAYFEGVSASTGIFLMAASPTGGITGRKMYGKEQNEELVLPRLVMKFHRHGRPQLNGTFKYYLTTFDYTVEDWSDLFIYSEKPIKRQVEFDIPFCCTESFNSDQLVTTALGNGIVDSAVHDLYGDTLRLGLKYKSNVDNADIVPSDLSGLLCWYKGDTGKTISGGKVVQWDDQSGNGNHLLQATAANAPTSGGNYVNFSLSWMESTNADQWFPAKRGSVFIVSYREITTPGDVTLLAIDSTNKWDISWLYSEPVALFYKHQYYSNAEAALYPATGYGGHIFGEEGVYGWDGGVLLFNMIRDGDTSLRVFHNGKEASASPMIIANVQPDSDNLIVGSLTSAGSDKFTGRIYEIIIYNRDLTDLERQKVEQYLSKRVNFNLYHIQ